MYVVGLFHVCCRVGACIASREVSAVDIAARVARVSARECGWARESLGESQPAASGPLSSEHLTPASSSSVSNVWGDGNSMLMVDG